MAFGFDNEEYQAPMAEINTTPLVDVMLVLMVIFLVTAPMLTQAIKLELPNETASTIQDEKPVTIAIDAEGKYYWNNIMASDSHLEEHMLEIANNPKQAIHLRADKKTSYERVSRVLAKAQKYGLTNIGFVTQPE